MIGVGKIAARGAMACLAGLLGAALTAPAAAQVSPSDFTSAVRYDAMQRVVGTISPDPDGPGPLKYAAVRNTYDADGQVIMVEKGELDSWQPENVPPSAWPGFTAFQRIDTIYEAHRKVQDAGASAGTSYTVTQYSYDALGRLECTAVRMNPAVFGSAPGACSLWSTGPDGPDRITRNVYDATDHLLQVWKAYGITTANGFPNTLEQNYATYTYTPNGKQSSITDANGNKAAYGYNGLDQLASWVFPSLTTPGATSATDREAYAYDANGNRTTLKKRDGRSITYTYDNLNRVTKKAFSGGGACVAGFACTTPPSWAVRPVYYSYDLRGLQTVARFDSTSGADRVVNAYDGFGRLSTSTTVMAGSSRTVSYGYDADGNQIKITHPDLRFFTFDYDGLDRVKSSHFDNDVPYFGITYDSGGRRSVVNRASSTNYYSYDAVSRLQTDSVNFMSGVVNSTTTFGYNPADQITSQARTNDSYSYSSYAPGTKSYAVNGLNQYTAVNAGGLGYDSNGNLASNGGTTFTYDVENRLVSAAGGMAAELRYDPLGRLWQTSGASGTTQFFYDRDAMINTYDGVTGAFEDRYVYGPGEDEPIMWVAGNTVDCVGMSFLHPDHQGSIVARADCWGNPVAIKTYDEYGVPSGGDVGRFQYTGQAWLPDLGMYYYKARIYSSGLGRFLQTDPVGYDDQNNLYAYVGNDPVNNEDPSGQCPACAGFLIGAGIDLGVQVAVSLGEGHSLKDSIRNADYKSVLVSGISGASGVGLVSVIERSSLQATAKAITTVAAGAANNIAGQIADNAAHGRSLGSGTDRAAVAGAVGATLGRGAAAAAEQRSFAQGVRQIDPGRTPGSAALATSDARRASEATASRTATMTESSVQAADKIDQKIRQGR